VRLFKSAYRSIRDDEITLWFTSRYFAISNTGTEITMTLTRIYNIRSSSDALKYDPEHNQGFISHYYGKNFNCYGASLEIY
jgi:hypothetical protein